MPDTETKTYHSRYSRSPTRVVFATPCQNVLSGYRSIVDTRRDARWAAGPLSDRQQGLPVGISTVGMPAPTTGTRDLARQGKSASRDGFCQCQCQDPRVSAASVGENALLQFRTQVILGNAYANGD